MNEVKAVKVAVLAAPCNVLAVHVACQPHHTACRPHCAVCQLHCVVCWPNKTLMGTPGGPEGPSGGGTIHENFLWSRIA